MSAATLELNEATTAKAAAEPQSAIHWFEIPCADLERAAIFYEGLLDVELKRATFGDPMAIFPYANGGTGGMLVQRRRQKPGPDGVFRLPLSVFQQAYENFSYSSPGGKE